MTYLKSALAGLAALVITSALVIGIAFGAPLTTGPANPPTGNGGAGWYFVGPWVPLWFMAGVPLLISIVVCMVAFRRLSRANERRY